MLKKFLLLSFWVITFATTTTYAQNPKEAEYILINKLDEELEVQVQYCTYGSNSNPTTCKPRATKTIPKDDTLIVKEVFQFNPYVSFSTRVFNAKTPNRETPDYRACGGYYFTPPQAIVVTFESIRGSRRISCTSGGK